MHSVVVAKPSANVKIKVERVGDSLANKAIVLPYFFSTQDLGFVLGAAVRKKSESQPYMSYGATAFAGADAKAIALGMWNYRLESSERLFFSSIGMLGDYPLLRAHAPPPNKYIPADVPRPGSNDSSANDFFASEGLNNWWDIKAEYVLPIGNAKKNPIQTYKISGGLLYEPPEEVASWNPLENGTSVVVLRQFNRYQHYKTENGGFDGSVHALELGIYHNNTDFPSNPSQGSSQYFSASYNVDLFKSTNDWSFLEFEASKYFSFGESDYFKQRILAMNMWAGYSPSWDVVFDGEGNSKVIDNPPFLEGASLGGMNRMRGYRQNRFHDKAAIYAAAEYRMTLDYNPLANLDWIKFLKIDRIQTVLFVEGGRVAPTFNSNVLFSDWKVDVGGSVRLILSGFVVRFDLAKSDEGTNMWLMFGHPF
ncbi:MAG: outer membrane protein assembly factor [Colwellia sp.]|nr:outer membrane protein assembly factor [Colwellia sp.]MCW9080382.1 outer membrane protein assembly factor [Colwellia sp.]